MTVRIRLEAADTTELDAHETALRAALTIPGAGSQDYPNRRAPGQRRYLESAGVRADPAAPVELAPLAAAEEFKRHRDLVGELGALRDADQALQHQPWYPIRPGDVVLLHLAADGHSPAYGETYLAVADDIDIAGNAMLRAVSRTRQPCDDVDGDDPAKSDPQYLLRYDRATGRWALDARRSGAMLQPWRLAPDLTDPDARAAARIWATQYLGDLVDDPDRPAYLEWRPHNDGWAPAFVDAGTRSGSESLTPFYDLWFEAGPGRLTVIRAGAVVHGAAAAAEAATSGAGRKGV